MSHQSNFDPFAGGEILRVAPTTAPQQEIITSTKMSEEANTAFNEAIALTINGAVDIELLKYCFNILVKRHEALRTTFSPAGDELCLHDAREVPFEFVDFSRYQDNQKSDAVTALYQNIALSPMNLEEGPLLFVWLLQLDHERFELIIAAHHLVCDGWSFGVLLNELAGLYNNSGSDDDLDPPDSFFDFSEKLSAEFVKNTDSDYWLKLFDKLPPTLDLPLDTNRPPNRTFTAARYDYHIADIVAAQLPKAASTLKSSKVNYILAAYFSLLYRLTGNEDIVVGLPLAGQAAFNRLNLVGHLVQLIPIRINLEGSNTFSELVTKVKNEVLRASEHPNFTFGQLLEKYTVDRSRVPIINTIFNIDQPSPTFLLGNANVQLRSIPRAADSFELFLNIVPSSETLLIEATYSDKLFTEETVFAWLKTLETILDTSIKNPAVSLDELVLTEEPPDQLCKLNTTDKHILHDSIIPAFHSQKNKTPQKAAAISDDEALSYEDLFHKSDTLAEQLYSIGVRENSIVGICCQRSNNLLISTLAILKLGAAYLPLDPDFPEDRLVYMIEDSGAIAVIDDESAPSGVRNTDIQHININAPMDNSDKTVELPELSTNPNRMAYIIYTSGSTGKPKGVKVQNKAMINFLESMAEKPGMNESDVLLAVTTLSFDISVLELFLPILVGGTVVIASAENYNDGEKLATLLEKHAVTIMQATPSTWRLLLTSRWGQVADQYDVPLKALCGGEPLPQSLVNDLLPNVSELWNMYGPTETTVWSTCKEIRGSDAFIAVGPPIANTQIYILDNNLNCLPLSVPGELCIGGDGVTLGYQNRLELNADRFVEHPEFGRIYRTGDLAKIHPSGEIQHLGRMDDQVKLRGYRIELGEIETALANCDGVQQAAIYLWTLSEEDVRIVACCVPTPGNSYDTIIIRKTLRQSLPNYMIPQYLLEISNMPLTPNGKIDRRSLPQPEINESSILSSSTLDTDQEKLIASIWLELLKIPGDIGREDNFFELGGHSLLALEAIRKIEIATNIRLEFIHLIEDRLFMLAERISEPKDISISDSISPVSSDHDLPVSNDDKVEPKKMFWKKLFH